MDMSVDDDQALQAVIGGLDHDQMDFKRLEELLSLSGESLGQNPDIFFPEMCGQPVPEIPKLKNEDLQSLDESDDLINYITGASSVLSPPESDHDPHSPEVRALSLQLQANHPQVVHSVEAGQLRALIQQQQQKQHLLQQQLPQELTLQQRQLLSQVQQQQSSQAVGYSRGLAGEQLALNGLPHTRVLELKREDASLAHQRSLTLTPSSHGSQSPQMSPASLNSPQWNQRPASNPSQPLGYGSPGTQQPAHQTFATLVPQQHQHQQQQQQHVHVPHLNSVSAGLDSSVQDLGMSAVGQAQYVSHPRAAKKRRLDEPVVKTELDSFADIQDLLGPDVTDSDQNGSPLDNQYQCLKWQPHAPSTWFSLLGSDLTPAPPVDCRVEADKGFNFSLIDDSFVCQKKNHFQVTVIFSLPGSPKYVNTQSGPKPIDAIQIHVHGFKLESQSSLIRVEQSQPDRSKKPYVPVSVSIPDDGSASKVTVGRLHFSETTSNNMRKKGKPNTDQRYFSLVVALHAWTSSGDSYVISSCMSERIIVRASNPGQFENDSEQSWKPGPSPDTVFHTGRVGINTDRPDEALTVHGNVRVTGRIMHPSDKRAKEGVEEVDTRKQLKNVSDLPLYSYRYRAKVAEYLGLPESDRHQVGVLAQELQGILPEAVRETDNIELEDGETIDKFLVVDKDRLYMENVGAVKELCKLTDNLETRIHELEHLNRRLKASSLKRSGSSKHGQRGQPNSEPSTQTTTPNSTPGSLRRDSSHRKTSLKQHEVKMVETSALCTPRFLQALIILLIIVMTASAIAMAVLFALSNSTTTTTNGDFGTDSGPVDNSSSILPISVNGSVNASISSTNQSRVVTVVPTATIIPSSQSTHTTTSSSQTVMATKVQSHGSLATTQPPTQLHPGLATTRVPVASSRGTSAQVTMPTVPSGLSDTCCVAHSNTPSPRIVQTQQTSSSPANAQTTWPTQTHMVSESGSTVMAASTSAARNPGGQQSGGQDPSMPMKRRRASGTDPMLSSVTLRLGGSSGFNATLQPFCGSRCSGNNTYSVDIPGDFMPSVLTLELKSTVEADIFLCANSTHEACDGNEPVPLVVKSVSEGTVHSWDLPISYYLGTSYSFLVIDPVTASNFTCETADPKQSGGHFSTYHFQFARVCGAGVVSSQQMSS